VNFAAMTEWARIARTSVIRRIPSDFAGAGHGVRTRIENELEALEITPDRGPEPVSESYRPETLHNTSGLTATSGGALTVEELEASIARLARALATASDVDFLGVVSELKTLRAELALKRQIELPANVLPIKRGIAP
jgi:hypothetical protein